jgi:hypothetical protein
MKRQWSPAEHTAVRARPERVLQAFEQLEHAANAGDNKTTDH